MGWLIKCTNSRCGKETWAGNIVDLITSHRDNDGWLLCQCGQHGYIEKYFDLQEPGETWEPFLRGVIPLGSTGNTYQPFVFLVSYKFNGPVNDIWFSYYKDLRASGGRLKLGYGPGGPPVLGKKSLLQLLGQLKDIGCLSQKEIDKTLNRPEHVHPANPK
jgi:hypothetical protein